MVIFHSYVNVYQRVITCLLLLPQNLCKPLAPPSRLTSAASATPPARRRPRTAAHAGPGENVNFTNFTHQNWENVEFISKNVGKMWRFTLGLSINNGDLKNIQPMNGILMWSSLTKMGKIGI